LYAHSAKQTAQDATIYAHRAKQTVQDAAMYACRAKQTAQDSAKPSGRTTPPAGLLLLLAQLCSFMENTAVLHVMEIIAATFPGQGGSSGSDQPPAFVAGEVARYATD